MCEGIVPRNAYCKINLVSPGLSNILHGHLPPTPLCANLNLVSHATNHLFDICVVASNHTVPSVTTSIRFVGSCPGVIFHADKC